jgi:hypothetical protein
MIRTSIPEGIRRSWGAAKAPVMWFSGFHAVAFPPLLVVAGAVTPAAS